MLQIGLQLKFLEIEMYIYTGSDVKKDYAGIPETYARVG